MNNPGILTVYNVVPRFFLGAIAVALGLALGLTVITIFTWILFA
jgi:hypothetical protein